MADMLWSCYSTGGSGLLASGSGSEWEWSVMSVVKREAKLEVVEEMEMEWSPG